MSLPFELINNLLWNHETVNSIDVKVQNGYSGFSNA